MRVYPAGRFERWQLAMLLFMGLFGCLCGQTLAAQPCIGLVTGSNDKFWDQMYSGSKAAGEQYGYDIYYRGPSKEDGYEAQGAILEQFMQQHCVGLLLAPNHPDRQRQVERIQAKGIVTVFLDRGLEEETSVPLVATDNYAAGRFAAKQMLRLLPEGKTNIALFRLQKDVLTTTKREQGFIDEATKNGLQIVLDLYAGTFLGDVKSLILNALKQSKTPIHGIFTPNETTTTGAVGAVVFLKLTESPIMVGFDSNDVIEEAIKDGLLAGTVLQKPVDMGYMGVKLIHDYITERKPIRSAVTDVEFHSKN